MIDQHLKPWLVEINYKPSLVTDTPLDHKIKQGLVKDTMKLIKVPGIVKFDQYAAEIDRRKDWIFHGKYTKLLSQEGKR